jgi:predicted ribosome quality control (RQC) complex YloA/Tae2 family protein
MSEFKKVLSRAHELNELLEKLSREISHHLETTEAEEGHGPAIIEKIEEFEKIKAEITGKIIESTKKFDEKKFQTDPVTGEPRFGPSMRIKIDDLVKLANDLMNTCLFVEEKVSIIRERTYRCAEDTSDKDEIVPKETLASAILEGVEAARLAEEARQAKLLEEEATRKKLHNAAAEAK